MRIDRIRVQTEAARFAGELFEAKAKRGNVIAEQEAISMLIAALTFIENQSGKDRVRRVVNAATSIAFDRATLKH